MEHELRHVLSALKDAFKFTDEHVAVEVRSFANQLDQNDVFFVNLCHGILVLPNAEDLMNYEKHQLLLIQFTHLTIFLLLDR